MAKFRKGGFTDKGAKGLNKAVGNSHGQFRAKAEAAGETTREFAKEHEHDSGKTGKQARLAETLMGMHHGGAKKLRYHASLNATMKGSRHG